MPFSERRWLSIQEAADYLSIHVKTAYEWAYSGILPAVRIGRNRRTLRIDKKKIDQDFEDQLSGDSRIRKS
jgi:excisionase family DNA binding protein